MIFLFAQNLFAQNTKTDSLLNEYQTTNIDTTKVNILNTISQNLSYSNSDTAYYYSSKAIELSKNINFLKGLALAYKIRGIICFYQGDIDKSMENFNSSLETYQEMGNKNGEAKIYNNMGVIYKARAKYEEAIEHYKKCIEVLKDLDDKNTLITVYSNIAITYSFQGNYNSSIEYNFNALKIIENMDTISDETEENQATIFMNIGLIYQKQNDTRNAKKYLNKALDIYISNNFNRGIADTYINLGSVEYDGNNYVKAIEFYNKALKIYTDDFKIATSNYHIGNSYNKLDDYAKSIEFFNTGLELYTKVDDPNGQAMCYNGIGEYYFQQGNYQKSIINLEKALNIGLQIGNVRTIENASEWLSLSYSKTGQYKKAYKTHVQFKEMHDSLFTKDNERKQTELAMNYEFDKEKKTKEIQHQAELKHQKIIHKAKTHQMRIIILSAFLGVALLMLLSLFIFKSYKTKQKANESLKLKNAEIFQQKEEIETQRDEIEEKKNDIEINHKIVVQQNKEIGASIHYAQRIQKAVLPNSNFIKQYLNDYFILFRPRDIVSGDFYWTAKVERNNTTYLIIAASDCTGHGVPGAFMSMLGISFLNEIVNKTDRMQANLILNQLREYVIKSLHQRDDKSESKDGMDIALTVINTENKELQFSGAYNSLYLIRNKNIDLPKTAHNKSKYLEYNKGEYNLFEIKADRMPIGIYVKSNASFTNYQLQLQKNDKIYLFSDGYADQFGGKYDRKYTPKNFKNLLLDICSQKMIEQQKIIDQTHLEWKANRKQLDDIIIIGVEV